MAVPARAANQPDPHSEPPNGPVHAVPPRAEKAVPFVQISAHFLQDGSIPIEVRNVLMYIALEQKGADASCEMSQGQLRKWTGYPEETLKAAVDYIREHKLAKVVERTGLPYKFFLTDPYALKHWNAPESATPAAPLRYRKQGHVVRGGVKKSTRGKLERVNDPGMFAEPPANGGDSSPGNLPPMAGTNLPPTAETPPANGGSLATQPPANGGTFLDQAQIYKETPSRSPRDETPDDDSSKHEPSSVDDVCEMLREVGVHVYAHQVGKDPTTGRRLTCGNLREWLEILPRLSARNPKGYVAAAIRSGRSLTEDCSASAKREQQRREIDARQQAEALRVANERTQQDRRDQETDALIANLSPIERRALRESVSRLTKVWLARDVDAERFALILAAAERRVFRGELSVPSAPRSYVGSANAHFFDDATQTTVLVGDLWERVCSELEKIASPSVAAGIRKSVRPLSYDNGVVTLGVLAVDAVKQVRLEFGKMLVQAFENAIGDRISLEYEDASGATGTSAETLDR